MLAAQRNVLMMPETISTGVCEVKYRRVLVDADNFVGGQMCVLELEG